MTRFTLDDLKKKGLVKNASGVYEKMPNIKLDQPLDRIDEGGKIVSKKGRPNVNIPVASLHADQMPGTTNPRKLVFSWSGKSVSLNQWYSSKHWSIRNKQAQEWHRFFNNFLISPIPFFEKYSIKMEHNSRLDNSNVIPMIKMAEDAIQRAGIIKDDTTKYGKSITIEFVETMKRGSFKLSFIEL